MISTTSCMTGVIQKKTKKDGELGRPESGAQRPTHLKNKENAIEGIQNDMRIQLYDVKNNPPPQKKHGRNVEEPRVNLKKKDNEI